MKKITILALLAIVFAACQSNSNKDSDNQKLADTDKHLMDESKTLTLPYVAVMDSASTYIKIEENPQRSKIPLTKDELAEALNIKYPEINLAVNKVSNDTLYVDISDASFLTQQYGTTGATTYLAEATYAFTELPDITVVNFIFKEGDHAIPGPYTRKSFNKENI